MLNTQLDINPSYNYGEQKEEEEEEEEEEEKKETFKSFIIHCHRVYVGSGSHFFINYKPLAQE